MVFKQDKIERKRYFEKLANTALIPVNDEFQL